MSAKPEKKEEAPAGDAPPPKSKKLLIIILAVVLVLVLVGGGGAFFLLSKKKAAADEEEDPHAAAPEPAKVQAHVDTAHPPAYLPLDPMVVNLADEGGERVAQIGITLELSDAHAVDTVKAYLPAIRSGILLQLSKRTAEELLKPEGKEKLAEDLLAVAIEPFGGGHESESKKKKKVVVEYPVVGVLFSSFIVQ